jgi:hypothetical protein
MKQHNSLISNLLNHGLALNLSLQALIIAAGFSTLLSSCSETGIEPQKADGLGSNPSANAIVTSPSANGIITTPVFNGLVTSPSATAETVTLSKMDLMMGRSSTAVGDVYVTIKSMDGTTVAYSELPVSALSTTASWVTFNFPVHSPQATEVIPGARYRIEITRSHPPVSGNGQVYVGGAVSASNDPYPNAASDRSANQFDYTFRTYVEDVIVDQQQLLYTSPVPVVPSNLGVSIRWQEFVVGVPIRPTTGS